MGKTQVAMAQIQSQIKTKERDGYSAIQVAYGNQKESRLSKALLGHYKKSNIKKIIVELS